MTRLARRTLPAALLSTLFAAAVLAQAQGRPKFSDIENIGSRDINKGDINFVSLEKEIALGRQLAAEMERSVKWVDDSTINEYINRIGQNLVLNSDARVPFMIKVVDSDEVNASALPGGFLFINTGVIVTAGSEAELASVLAHQIARVAARHGTEIASKGQLNIASMPTISEAQSFADGSEGGNEPALPSGVLQFLRDGVTEADYLGVQYLYKAGYDPGAAVRFLEKLQALESARQEGRAARFRTHPPSAQRIQALQRNIDLVLPRRGQNVSTTVEFEAIKRRVADTGRNR